MGGGLAGSEKVLPGWGWPPLSPSPTDRPLHNSTVCLLRQTLTAVRNDSESCLRKEEIITVPGGRTRGKAQVSGSCPWAVNSQGPSYKSPGITVGNPHSIGEQCRAITWSFLKPSPTTQLWHFEKHFGIKLQGKSPFLTVLFFLFGMKEIRFPKPVYPEFLLHSACAQVHRNIYTHTPQMP